MALLTYLSFPYSRRMALWWLALSSSMAVQAYPDSLQVLVQTAVEEEVSRQLWPIWWLLGVSVAGLTGLGMWTWFFGIKKQVDALVKEKAAPQVEKELAALTGVRADTLRSFFSQYQAERDAMARQRIWIVFAPGVKQQELTSYLHKVGMSEATAVDTSRDLKEQIQANDFLVFVDQNGAELSDQAIDDYGRSFGAQGKFFYYGPRRYAGELRMASFANTQATLLNRLKDAILG